MASPTWTRLGRTLAGLVIVLVLLVATAVIVIRYQWRQGEQEVRDEQAAEAKIMAHRLERYRDAGQFDDGVDTRVESIIEDLVHRSQGGQLVSVTERPDDVRVVAVVGVPPHFAIMVGGLDEACFGFTVPPSPAPITVERLSPEEGRWPEECYTFST